MRLRSITRENVLFYSGFPKAERTQHLYATLMPGLYVILVAPYISGMEGIFTMSLLSNYKLSVSQMWPVPLIEAGGLDGMLQDESSVYLDHLIGKGFAALVGTGDKSGSKKKAVRKSTVAKEGEKKVSPVEADIEAGRADNQGAK